MATRLTSDDKWRGSGNECDHGIDDGLACSPFPISVIIPCCGHIIMDSEIGTLPGYDILGYVLKGKETNILNLRCKCFDTVRARTVPWAG